MRGMNSLLSLPRGVLIGLVRGYRLLLSPWLGQSCRFAPTCSAYAIEALQRHGACVGTGLAAWRVLRCNPLCEGGCDAVPDNMPWERVKASRPQTLASGLFTGLVSDESGVVLPAANSAATANGDPTPFKTSS